MENMIKKHEINHLMHFTNCQNLESIFTYGLLTRETLDYGEFDFQYNDNVRADVYEDSISLSISFPNWQMFYSLQKEHPEIDWAVLVLTPDVLIDKKCAFCVENAAKSSESCKKINEKFGADALNMLFQDYPGKPSRSSINLQKKYTTNPQSEVLVFEEIERTYIYGVLFKNKRTKEKYLPVIPDAKKTWINPKFFNCRCDYELWRRNG